jgi:5'-nucleotidase
LSSSTPGRVGARAVAAGIGLSLAAATLVIAPAANAVPVQVQILATNDFHGRLLPESGGIAGAAKMAGVVKQLEEENPNTLFTAAGDLIGASTFESFIQQDKPTIDVLNKADLDVSAVGNHELDQGYNDLVNRVMAPFNATTNPRGGAEWQYIAANLRKKADNSPAVPESWIADVGGVQIGFVGAVTEDLPSLVSPAGIADIQVTNIVNAVNATADTLTAGGADLVVLLVHEGAATTSIASATDPNSAFGKIVLGVDSDVDAIVSGHTHLAYNHLINGRPVVSAGQYGMNLNKLVFNVENGNVTPSLVSQSIVPIATTAVTDPDAQALQREVQTIVDAAVAQSETLGARPLGHIAGRFDRARLADGTTENRGGESTLGNLVAEVQRWATSTPEAGGAQIAFMNPGGLRQDMIGNSASGFPAVLTYKQAAVVQPFANTLVNMRLTGAQIKKVLEQQWQRDAGGNIPTRPFLRLGTSKGFKFTYDPTRPEGDRITGMWLNGTALVPTSTYSVTVNSFLASGGDNFREFTNGTQKRDTGKVDLQAMVDYLAEFASQANDPPLPVDYAQHAIGLTFPAGAPRAYRYGEKVEFRLTSLAMTAPNDKRDAKLDVKVGNVDLKDASVNNVVGTAVFDEYGVSNVASRLKGKVPIGAAVMKVTGPTTGTTLDILIQIRQAKPTMTVKVKPKRIHADRTNPRVKVKLTAPGLQKVKGKVRVKAGGRTYEGKLEDGKVKLRLREFGKAGKKKIQVKYLGTVWVDGTRETVKIKVRRR